MCRPAPFLSGNKAICRGAVELRVPVTVLENLNDPAYNKVFTMTTTSSMRQVTCRNVHKHQNMSHVQARGFSIGELGAARRFVEGAVELRLPVLGSQVYAFAETAHDLGSSKDVKGNPTRYFRRAGAGSSLGAGIKLGAARAEYATDSNTGRGTFFVRFGERF